MSDDLGGKPERRGAFASGLTAALRLLDRAERRPPTEADQPAPSTFPMTPAAREALRMARQADRRRKRGDPSEEGR